MISKSKKWKTDGKIIARSLLGFLIFIALIPCFTCGAAWFLGKANTEGTETLRMAIRRASVQCYAIEGRYPPSVQYLEENYGIMIDRERYHVFYNGFASNIMPEITVIETQSDE